MQHNVATLLVLTALSVNVAFASPSPLNRLPEYEIGHAVGAGTAAFADHSLVARLRGRKRRTPADFVRPFAPALPVAAIGCDAGSS